MPMREHSVAVWQLEPHREETFLRGITLEDRHLRSGQQRRGAISPLYLIGLEQVPMQVGARAGKLSCVLRVDSRRAQEKQQKRYPENCPHDQKPPSKHATKLEPPR